MITAAIAALVILLILAACITDLPALAQRTRKALSPAERKKLRRERSHELTGHMEGELAATPDAIDETIADIDRQLGPSSGKDTK
jgi:hypothetical protein